MFMFNKYCHNLLLSYIHDASSDSMIRQDRLKVKLSLCLTKHHAMKACWWSGGIAPRILKLGNNGGECSASRVDRFNSVVPMG
jgi:hypothetical protein